MIFKHIISKLKSLTLEKENSSRDSDEQLALTVAYEEAKKSEETEDYPYQILRQFRSLNLNRFKETAHEPLKRHYPSDLKKYLRLGITPHVFIDSLMPVYLNCREVSSCALDQINFQSSFEQIEIIAEEIKKDYGLLMDFVAIPLDSGCMISIFFFKDSCYYQQLEQLQKQIKEISARNGRNLLFIVDDPTISKKWGEILGYPKCCIDFLVKTRKNGERVELKSVEMLREISKGKRDSGGNKIVFEFNPVAYYSFEFYPCCPSCKKASSIGKKISLALNKQKPLLNMAYNLTKCLNLNNLLFPGANLNQKLALRQEIDRKIEALLNNTKSDNGSKAEEEAKKTALLWIKEEGTAIIKSSKSFENVNLEETFYVLECSKFKDGFCVEIASKERNPPQSKEYTCPTTIILFVNKKGKLKAANQEYYLQKYRNGEHLPADRRRMELLSRLSRKEPKSDRSAAEPIKSDSWAQFILDREITHAHVQAQLRKRWYQ